MGAAHTGRSGLRSALLKAMPTSGNAAILEVTVVPEAGGETDWFRHPFDAVLLMGLDLPSARNSAPQDQAWRAQLQQANVGFQVVYGVGPARLKGALAALAHLRPELGEPLHTERLDPARWQWRCEKCSDADCEHRLFTALKGGTPGVEVKQTM